MGGSSTKPAANARNAVRQTPQAKHTFHTILDQFETIGEVQDALQTAGLESSQLIVGIDFTKSNEWTGESRLLV